MSNVDNITSSNPGRNGVAFRAPVGSALPDDASTLITDVDAGYKDLGIVGEDGVVQTITRDTEDVKSYGGDTVYTLQTDYGEEFTLTFYESYNVETLRAVYGDDNVIESGGNIKILHNKQKLPRSSFVFDHQTDKGDKRQVLPIAQVTSVGDIANVHSDIVKYEVTVKAYPDASGNVVYEYLTDEQGRTVLAIATDVLKAAEQKKAYDVTIAAVGGESPYTFTAVGAVPAGLKLESNGRLHGTPTGTGSQKLTVKVTDSASTEVQKELTLNIAAASEE